MAKPTYGAVDLNAVLTAHTHEYINRKVANQSFTTHPILDDLRKNGKKYDGGVNIVAPVLDGYTPVGGTVTRGSTITLTHVDHITQARYSPVWYQEPVILDWTDETQAGGAGAMLNYVESALDAGLMRLQEKIVTDLCASTTATNGVGSLLDYIDSTGAIGGINPATTGQSWWAAYENSSVGSFASGGADVMRDALLGTAKYKMLGRPNKIYADETFIKAYMASGLSIATVQYSASSANGRVTDIGTGTLNYEGIPVVYEPHLDTAGGIALGINFGALWLAELPGVFRADPWVNLLPGGRLARGTVLKWCGQLVMQARSPNFKLDGVTA